MIDLSAKVPVRTIKVGKRKLPYAGLTGCPQGSLTFGYAADYTDGTTSKVETVQPCSGVSAPTPAPSAPAPAAP